MATNSGHFACRCFSEDVARMLFLVVCDFHELSGKIRVVHKEHPTNNDIVRKIKLKSWVHENTDACLEYIQACMRSFDETTKKIVEVRGDRNELVVITPLYARYVTKEKDGRPRAYFNMLITDFEEN